MAWGYTDISHLEKNCHNLLPPKGVLLCLGKGQKQEKKKHLIFHEWVAVQTNLHLSFIFVFFPKKGLKRSIYLCQKWFIFFVCGGGSQWKDGKSHFLTLSLGKVRKFRYNI